MDALEVPPESFRVAALVAEGKDITLWDAAQGIGRPMVAAELQRLMDTYRPEELYYALYLRVEELNTI